MGTNSTLYPFNELIVLELNFYKVMWYINIVCKCLFCFRKTLTALAFSSDGKYIASGEVWLYKLFYRKQGVKEKIFFASLGKIKAFITKEKCFDGFSESYD